jgi:hypothetical protein
MSLTPRNLSKIALIAALCFAAFPSVAQDFGVPHTGRNPPATLAGTTSCSGGTGLLVNTPGAGTAEVDVRGTFGGGSAKVQASADLANWTGDLTLYPNPSGASVTSITAAGNWTLPVTGNVQLCVYVAAVTSLTVVVTFTPAEQFAKVEGFGIAGTPAGGVVSIQGVASGTAVPVSGTITTTPPSNASTNLAQVAASTVATLAAGEQKVGAEGLAADNAVITGNPVPEGCKVVAVAGAPATATAGNVAYVLCSEDRVQYVRTWHPNLIHCVVAASVATTLTAFGSSCATPGAGKSIYITDILFSSSAAGGTAADSFPTIKSGTGGTCGTATAVVWGSMTAANGVVVENRSTPIRIAANSEICWIMSTAGTKQIQVSGFIAP